ncbi:MAG: leucine-rich repeat domain-containing protein [Anaerofustis stercorihominis]|nr:leucine-rich repeat domain-containing protein [Anaerofustis stercorihominis]
MKTNRSLAMKRVFATVLMIALCICFCCAFTSDVYAAQFSGGSGTKSDPYLIADKYQLDLVRNYRSSYFKMIADITFTEADFAEGGDFYNNGQGWTPIGGQSTFRGVFDGDGHKISGLYVNITESAGGGFIYAGLFGYGSDCSISNLSLINSDISVNTESADDYIYVGSIIGSAMGSSTITDCTVSGNLSSSSGYVGGIAGCLYGEIESCTNYANITSYEDAGGIVCKSRGVVDSCINEGSVNAKYKAGGIVGWYFSDPVEISNCINKGTVTVGEGNTDKTYVYVGGIAGSAGDKSTVQDSMNYGDVRAQSDRGFSCYAGGIIGNNKGSVYRCGNAGNVTVISQGSSYCGGITGYTDDSGTAVVIDQCFNQGDIYSPVDSYCYCGGITGFFSGYTTVSNCFNMGTIKSEGFPGGIIGGTGGYVGNISVEQCYNAGSLISFDPDRWTSSGYGKMADCFYLDVDNYGRDVIPGYAPGKALSYTEMTDADSFTNFDFDKTWTMEGSDYPYPELRWAEPSYTKVEITTQPEDVTVANGEKASTGVRATGDGRIFRWYYADKGSNTFAQDTSVPGNTYSVKMNSSVNGRRVYCVVTDKYGVSAKSDTVTLSMKGAVVITSQPKDVMVTKGEMARVTVGATGDSLTYKWYFKNPYDGNFAYTSTFTGNSYYVKMDETRDGRKVYCIITDKYGNIVRSDTVTLSMDNAVAITTQPKNVTVAKGATAKVTVSATGDGLTYKWYFKNPGASKFSYTSSFTGNSYSVKMDETRNGRQVYCVVADKYGNSVQSDTVTLSMQSVVEITSQPKDVTVTKGEMAEVTVGATGEGLTYKWYFKNAGASKFSYTSSFAGNSYSVKMDETRDGRQVYCVVTDEYGNSVQSDTVMLSMQRGVEIASGTCGENLTWTLDDNGTLIISGTGMIVDDGSWSVYKESITTVIIEEGVTDIDLYGFRKLKNMTCVVIAGSVECSYECAFAGCTGLKNVILCDGATRISSSMFQGCDNLENLFVPKSLRYIGETFYDCAPCDVYYAGSKDDWEDIAGVSSSNNVELRSATMHYNCVSGVCGDSLIWSLQSDGTLIFAGHGDMYDWQSGSDVAWNECKESVTAVEINKDMTDIGKNAFSACDNLTDIYYDGSISDWNKISIAEGAIPESVEIHYMRGVEITSQPKNVAVASGATAKVTLTATGEGLTYKWYFKNAGSNKFSYTSSFTGNSYSVKMDASRDGRQVYCVVTDKYGNSVQSATATLSMSGVKITSQPKSVTVAKGATAKVTLTATGEGLTYKWYFKNTGSSKFSYTSSFTGNSYSVKMDESRSGRQVYCVVTDKYGNSVQSDTVTLSMGGAVAITTQPKSVTVAKGTTAKVTVSAIGEGLTYKWYFKNAGASKFSYTSSFTGDSYSVKMDASRDGRQVYCVVTDKYGNSVRSNTVTLSMK